MCGCSFFWGGIDVGCGVSSGLRKLKVVGVVLFLVVNCIYIVVLVLVVLFFLSMIFVYMLYNKLLYFLFVR